MDWARFSAEYATLTLMSGAERNLALATLAEQDGRLSDLLRNQLEREDTAEFMATSAPSSPNTYPDLLASGARIGSWRIERVLGTGGMGAVYRVTRDDGTFEQTAALKTLRRSGEALSLRFENERRRLAMLEHPNIARIIDGGADDDGQPFMVVELVEGEPIDQWASGKSRTEKLRLLRQLCSALAHAHARLVLHRDIKPGNVLVNEAGEVRLIDFGIAELADDDAVSGPGPLTFVVAAPEQLEGGQITTATDIFQVGMLAHRLLAGTWPARQPDGGVSIDERNVRDPDLCAILTKAIAKDPAKRYESVDALGEDFEKFHGGFPVSAVPASSMTRFRKAVARNKFASAMSAAAAIALIVGVAGVSVFAIRANNEAEANRITQERGARQIELYETFNAGFTEFVATIDPESAAGKAMVGALAQMERFANSIEKDDPQRALEVYVFLTEMYGDAGMDLEASRAGARIARGKFKPSYPLAYSLSNVSHLSQGYVPPDELIGWLDRAEEFFSSQPIVNAFDIAINRCVKSRLTGEEADAALCIDLVEAQLSASGDADYATRAANLTLQAYAIQAAVALEQYDKAKQLASEALAFAQTEERPLSVHAADFFLQLSDIAQLEKDWLQSRTHLLGAFRSLQGNPELYYLELDANKEMAETQIGMKNFVQAKQYASQAVAMAEKTYGPDHFQSRDSKANLASAMLGLGEVDAARNLIESVIEVELRTDQDAVALEKYRAIQANIRKGQDKGA